MNAAITTRTARTATPLAAAGPVLSRVRATGSVRAVVSRGIRGLSLPGPDGRWEGLDADIARAVAAAATGDAEAVTWLPTDPADRLARLRAGEADLVTSNLTWTLGREAHEPVLFAGVTCYDGEGFLVREADGFASPVDLAGQRLAVQTGTTSASNLAAWFGARGLSVEPVAYATPDEALAGYASGECAAYVLDRIALAGARAGLPDPGAHTLLETTISREPMAMAVSDTDVSWFRICRWVLSLLFAAEHDAAAVAAAGAHGPALGLDEDWAARVIAAVGTYGDIYDRHLGAGSALGVPRGANALWTDGGLHYALPLH